MKGYWLLVVLLTLNAGVTCLSWWTLSEALKTTRAARELLHDLSQLKAAAVRAKETLGDRLFVQDGVARKLWNTLNEAVPP